MVVGWHRPTRMIIDTAAITANVSNEMQQLSDEQELFAVVKANGYGHGALETAKAAKKGGATGFCVALLDEAIELREAGFDEPILILSRVEVSYLKYIATYDLSVTVGTLEWLEEAIEYVNTIDCPGKIKIHLKVDTGMGRIGFQTVEETIEATQKIAGNSALVWEGIFTHFSTADEEDEAFFHVQAQRFQHILDHFSELPRYVHTSNSATALFHNGGQGNMIRFGIAMYGLNPSGGTLTPAYELKPALRLVTSLIQVKKIEAGESVGYGKTYTASANEWIGTLPIGYADGWLRHLQGFNVLVNGQKCEIVGRICMDQCMIRLQESVPVGTEVTLVGKNQEEEITLQMVADQLATIHYEVACTFSERIPREYI